MQYVLRPYDAGSLTYLLHFSSLPIAFDKYRNIQLAIKRCSSLIVTVIRLLSDIVVGRRATINGIFPHKHMFMCVNMFVDMRYERIALRSTSSSVQAN